MSLTPESSQNIFDKITKWAKKDHIEAEALFVSGQKTSVSFQKNNLEKFDVSSSQCLGIRVVSHSSEGYSFTEDFRDQSIEKSYKDAVSNSQYIAKDYSPQLANNQKILPIDHIYNESLEKIDVKEKISLAKELEKSGRLTDTRITALPYNGYSEFLSSVRLMTTTGFQQSYKSNGCYLFAMALAKGDHDAQMGAEVQAGKNILNFDAVAVGKSAAHKAIKRLNSQIPKTGKYSVVFNREAAQTLIGFLLPMFSGKKVFEKTSLLAGKLGETLFSSKLTLSDDPFLTNSFGCRPFDDEGSPSKKNLLIENGQLKTFLTNSVFAEKLNLINTCNASRSPKSDLGIGSSNLVVNPGELSFEKLINLNTKTIVITNLKGTAGYNPISGDFSIESEGEFYENGEFIHSLGNFVVSGNIIEALKNIEQVGNDQKISESTIISPSFLIPEINIAGK